MTLKVLATFLDGAAVGAVVSALLTPTTGEDLRARIKMMLQKKGIIAADDIDELVDLIASEVESNK